MPSFYFYDLETSGINPRAQRIMQFAGQRTTLDLEPIGEPHDVLISFPRDILPEPEAVLLTGITPQQTWRDGYTEYEFLKLFHEEIALPDTIFVGFNTIRFDDEFMRSLMYRNLYDPYEWQWKDGRGKWDLLDVARMTRALRPDGIVWPEKDGKPINRLEEITAANKLQHDMAHNALSDVLGSIEVAKLIKKHQPKLFDYMLASRTKDKVHHLVDSSAPFVYTSGRYSSEFQHTTVACKLAHNATDDSVWVYDLRFDPVSWLKDQTQRPPYKKLKYNKCPAVAPLNVLDATSWQRIGLDTQTIQHNLDLLRTHSGELLKTLPDSNFAPAPQHYDEFSAEEALYDGFIADADKKLLARIRTSTQDELTEFLPKFQDKRLEPLFFLYKARNFPKTLLAEERERYEAYIYDKFTNRFPIQEYMQKLSEIAQKDVLNADTRYILEELALYAQSIVPLDSD